MLVEMDDIYVGQIQHKRRFWKPIYSIVDAQGFPVYSVVGRRAPGCRICCRPLEVKFQVRALFDFRFSEKNKCNR